jgi:hypothetical protein
MQPMLTDPVAGEKRPSATCRCVTGAGRSTSAAIRAVEFSPLQEAGRSSELLPAGLLLWSATPCQALPGGVTMRGIAVPRTITPRRS